MNFIGRILDLLCPPVCAFCGESLERSGPACEKCVEKIVTPDGRFCLRCGGRRFQRTKGKEPGRDACQRCRTSDFRFLRVIALGEYEQDLRTAVLRMKTDRTGLMARSAVDLLISSRKKEIRDAAPDFVVPVPMHRSRRWQRGVNSPDILAERLGVFLNVPVYKCLLRRTRATDLQYLLSRQNRQANVDGAFELTGPRLRRKIEGRNALLVDDILTTGATCNEIARLLIRAGVAGVTVCVLARAEGSYRKDHEEYGEKR